MKSQAMVLVCWFALSVPGAALALDSESIMTHAKAYSNHTWVCTSSNKTAWCKSSYSSDYGPGTYKGVAYDWGGFDSLTQYDDKLAQGYGAGSHSWHGVLSCTTGVDCSGYVSRCWELPTKYGTATIQQVSHKISKNDLLPGDAWNKPSSHIVLWAGTASDGGPLFYEASGSASKVRYNTAASWGYLSSYTPIRFNDYDETPVEPMTEGTLDAPIVITGFPFTHSADTKNSSSDTMDSYSCAPQTGEVGPEVVYVFTLTSGGKLSASVTDSSGTDVDLHLLSAPNSAACVVRHDKAFEVEVDAGSYWLIVDSWSDSGGVIYPGKYTLNVDFKADEAQPVPPADLPGSLGTPFVIQSFPFHHDGNTKTSPSDVFNSYSCEPGKGEAGPEVFYVFTVYTPGVFEAKLWDGDGVDIDLHLLSGPSVNSCIVRGHTKVTAELTAGAYWLVADSWSDGNGIDYPGPYSLDAFFLPTGGPCTPSCAGKQCGSDGCGGLCGTCNTWFSCVNGQCQDSPKCGDGLCEPGFGEGCEACPQDCPCGCGQACVENICVLSACAHSDCGADGCGGSCGECEEGHVCSAGFCVDESLLPHAGSGVMISREADPDEPASAGPWVVSGDAKQPEETYGSGCSTGFPSAGSLPLLLWLLVTSILTLLTRLPSREK